MKIHFVGISSPFSSLCAQYFLAQGHIVTASELSQETSNAKYWLENGILFPGPHSAKYITDDLDLVVFPNAPIPGNPECDEVLAKGILYKSVAVVVGEISQKFKTIAIAGTHGKTTTTALIVWMLTQLGRNPSFALGDASDKILNLNKNWSLNIESEYLVIEACEYRSQFLKRAPSPQFTVITHIDLDHTDFFKTQLEYNLAFKTFINNTTDKIVIDTTKSNEKWCLGEKRNIVDVSSYRDIVKFSSLLFGTHNYENLLRAYCLGLTLNYKPTEVLTALNSFPGVSKRLELLQNIDSRFYFYRDYAHNPQKVSSCIESVKEHYPNMPLIAVFEGHSHERIFSFKKEFINAFTQCDLLYFYGIYAPSRESIEDRKLISDSEFYTSLKSSKINVVSSSDIDFIVKDVVSRYPQGAVVVFMSAGKLSADVTKVFPTKS